MNLEIHVTIHGADSVPVMTDWRHFCEIQGIKHLRIDLLSKNFDTLRAHELCAARFRAPTVNKAAEIACDFQEKVAAEFDVARVKLEGDLAEYPGDFLPAYFENHMKFHLTKFQSVTLPRLVNLAEYGLSYSLNSNNTFVTSRLAADWSPSVEFRGDLKYSQHYVIAKFIEGEISMPQDLLESSEREVVYLYTNPDMDKGWLDAIERASV